MAIYLFSNREIVEGKFEDKHHRHDLVNRKFRMAEVTVIGKKAEIGSISPYSSNKMLEVLESISGDGEAMFFIIGFGNSLEACKKVICELKRIYMKSDSNIKHMIFISWSSLGRKPLRYNFDKKRSLLSGNYLTNLMKPVYEAYKNGNSLIRGLKIHLVAKSMGNKVLRTMMKSTPAGKMAPLFQEIVLLTPDVDHTIFDETDSFARLNRIGRRITVYFSKSDDTFRIANAANYSDNQLGCKGPANMNTLPTNTFIVDTTNVGKARSIKEALIDHWAYLDRPAVRADIKKVLRSEEIFPKRRLKQNGHYKLND